MAGQLLLKPGVVLTKIAPGGMRILEALKATAKDLGVDITITCGNEAHPPNDPHTLGAALDCRTHEWPEEQKHRVLRTLMGQLQRGGLDLPIDTSGGLATMYFFAWIEAPGTTAEHLHVQVRKGVPYTIGDYLAA